MPGGGGSPPPSNVQFAGAHPQIYTPTNQGNTDTAYQNLVNSLYGPAMGGLQQTGFGAITPAGFYWPQVESSVSQLYNNPYAGQAQDTANIAAQWGQNIGQKQNALGLVLEGAGEGMIGENAPLMAAGQQVFNTGFDPQSALFNREQQRLTDQTRAALASSGVGGSPYAAGVEGQTLGNFDIDWQNQQLQRQLSGLKGLEGAGLAGANIAGTGAGIAGTGAGLQSTGLNTYLRSGQLPYETSVGQAETGLGGIGTGINLGNNIYALPQQVLNDQQSYLQLGQAAGNQALGASALGGNQQLDQARLLGSGLQGIGGLAALSQAGGAADAGIIPGVFGEESSVSPGGFLVPGTDTILGADAGATAATGGGILSQIPIIGPLAGALS